MAGPSSRRPDRIARALDQPVLSSKEKKNLRSVKEKRSRSREVGDGRDKAAAAAPTKRSSPSNSLQIGSATPTPEDINKRAENFIADFYHRARLERQNSPQLRVCNDKLSSGWFPWRSPISPASYFSLMSKVNVPSPTSSPAYGKPSRYVKQNYTRSN